MWVDFKVTEFYCVGLIRLGSLKRLLSFLAKGEDSLPYQQLMDPLSVTHISQEVQTNLILLLKKKFLRIPPTKRERSWKLMWDLIELKM